ncbi:hypothetical protein BN1012_Phect2376 [Candidatus Phaeomarinobacter ectocarpi]|uniref:Uncharacterized protein n=2 Tax=Candidatus Phaeomarinibacter ectocarpi TaxID=1458461 RepID=X5MGI0_9HYPH|nr:hypothetical protein BN1012_Phect2376 [Candidatus Phaeomarinobacter ectocarpi]
MNYRHGLMGALGGVALLVLSSHAAAQDPQPGSSEPETFEPEVFEAPTFEVPDFEMPVFEALDIALPELDIPDLPDPPDNAEAERLPRDVFRSEASQPERADTDWLTEAYERILPNAEDSWVLTIHKTRTGHSIYRWEDPSRDRWNNTHDEWHYGPASVSVRLATYDSYDGYGHDGISVQLALWQNSIATWLENIKTKESYEPIAEEAQVVIDYMKSRSEDAELLIRVLQGLQFYTVIEDRDYDPANTKPVSSDTLVHLEGGTFSSDFTGSWEDPVSSTTEMPRVNSQEFDALDNGPHRTYSAVVWRFVPEDMARVAVLIEEYEEIKRGMTLDLTGVDLPEHLESMLVLVPGLYHNNVRDPFLAALYEIARVAWWIGPYEADASVWATSEDQIPDGLRNQFAVMREEGGRLVDGSGTPYFNATTPLQLPPLETDTLVMIDMAMFGITNEPGEIPKEPYYPGKKDINNFDAQHSFSPGSATRERISYRREDDLFWRRTIVHAAGTGEVIKGRVNITSEHYKIDVNPDSNARNITDERQTHNVVWSLSHDGDIWAPKPPEIVARFVRPNGTGDYEPLSDPLDYGSPFAVEGRLELPAARQVYNLEIDYGGERPHDVLLYPTEEDRTVLRSDILYLMWDVAHAEASVAGAEASR